MTTFDASLASRTKSQEIKLEGTPVVDTSGRIGDVTYSYRDHAVRVRWSSGEEQRVSIALLAVDYRTLIARTSRLVANGGVFDVLATLCKRIAAFDSICEAAQHIDASSAWDLLLDVRDDLERLLPPLRRANDDARFVAADLEGVLDSNIMPESSMIENGAASLRVLTSLLMGSSSKQA